MATLSTAARNAQVNATVGLIDKGTTNSAGVRVLLDSSGATVATLTFSNPAYGSAASGSASTNAVTADTNAAGGTVASFSDRDLDGNEIYSGTVTATGGGGELTMSSVTVGAGDTVEQTSATTFTVAAS